MRMDVLDLHGGFVDEHADGKRESAERHDVDRLARQPQADDGGQNRKRNRNHDDQRAAKIAEEQQHHQAGQKRTQEGFSNQSV